VGAEDRRERAHVDLLHQPAVLRPREPGPEHQACTRAHFPHAVLHTQPFTYSPAFDACAIAQASLTKLLTGMYNDVDSAPMGEAPATWAEPCVPGCRLATPLPQMYDDDELDVCAPDDEEDDLVLDDDAARRASSWRERMRAAGFDDDDDDDLYEFVHAEACVVPQAWDEVCDDFECVYDDLYDHAGASDA